MKLFFGDIKKRGTWELDAGIVDQNIDVAEKSAEFPCTPFLYHNKDKSDSSQFPIPSVFFRPLQYTRSGRDECPSFRICKVEQERLDPSGFFGTVSCTPFFILDGIPEVNVGR